jgi:hypothetical protein
MGLDGSNKQMQLRRLSSVLPDTQQQALLALGQENALGNDMSNSTACVRGNVAAVDPRISIVQVFQLAACNSAEHLTAVQERVVAQEAGMLGLKQRDLMRSQIGIGCLKRRNRTVDNEVPWHRRWNSDDVELIAGVAATATPQVKHLASLYI